MEPATPSSAASAWNERLDWARLSGRELRAQSPIGIGRAAPCGALRRSRGGVAGSGGRYLARRTAMRRPTFSARYTAAMADCGGRCPIEAGVVGRLADDECRHGRLPYGRTPACGCRPQEGAAVMILPAPRLAGASSREAA